jgi:hypothetical protein
LLFALSACLQAQDRRHRQQIKPRAPTSSILLPKLTNEKIPDKRPANIPVDPTPTNNFNMASVDAIKDAVSHYPVVSPACKSSQALQEFRSRVQKVLDKLQKDPLSITTEDARRLSENYEANDARSAKIISAVESLAVAAQELHEDTPSLGQGPQTSLFTVVNDLKVAVDASPKEVTSEILETTQSIVSSMFTVPLLSFLLATVSTSHRANKVCRDAAGHRPDKRSASRAGG